MLDLSEYILLTIVVQNIFKDMYLSPKCVTHSTVFYIYYMILYNYGSGHHVQSVQINIRALVALNGVTEINRQDTTVSSVPLKLIHDSHLMNM